MFIISCNLQIYYILSIFCIKIKDETLNTLCVCQNIYLCLCVIVLYLVCPMLAVSGTVILDCLFGLFEAYLLIMSVVTKNNMYKYYF